MSFIYKNPLSNIEVSEPQSVDRTNFVGTNYSVLQVGGYQEVFYLDNLKLTFSGTGLQQLSANTIPIQINLQPNTGFSFTTLTLNSDNISSGRRRLGMLVYVHETDTVYQYTIPNYEQEWNTLTGLTGSSAITQSQTYTQINARSQVSKDFISLWTGSTIEGVSGVTRNNARWRIFKTSTATTENFEYVAINSVPASMAISAYTTSAKMRNTFITIPQNFNGKDVVSVSASYGDHPSLSAHTFTLEMRDDNNLVVDSTSWEHPAGTRIYNQTVSGLTLMSGHTINIGGDSESVPGCLCYSYDMTGSPSIEGLIYYTGCTSSDDNIPVGGGYSGTFCALQGAVSLFYDNNLYTYPDFDGLITEGSDCYTSGPDFLCTSPTLGGEGYSATFKVIF